MYISLIFKEWVKSRRALLLICLLFVGVMIYIFLNISQIIRANSIIAVCNSIIMKDISLISSLVWIPLLSGVLLAVAQFIPEMHDKRLKITLHLPMREDKIVLVMLLFGVISLIVIFLLVDTVLISGFSYYFAKEIGYNVLMSSLPWFVSGLIAYLFSSWIIMETQWKNRLKNSLLACSLLPFFYLEVKSGAYGSVLPLLIVIPLIILAFPFYSVIRFKDGY